MPHLSTQPLSTSPNPSLSSDSLPQIPKSDQLSRTVLIETIALLLEEMIEQASKDYKDPKEISQPTAFHAEKLPSISVKDYLIRFGKFSNCHDNAFVFAMIYLDKIGEFVPDFELDSFNIHRFILISMVTACKFYDDYRYKNGYYARIGGVSHQEFNRLEQEYLVNYIQFSLYVDVETFDSYYQDLTNFYQEKSSQ